MSKIFEWLEDSDNRAKVAWAFLALSLVCGIFAIWFESPKSGATGGVFFVVTVILAVTAS